LEAINCIRDREAVVLLSGGVDSTALAYLLRQKVTRLEAIVMAVRPTHSSDPPPDLAMARRAAAWLGIRLTEILVSPQQLIRAVPATVRLAETRRASIVDELAGMFFVAHYLKERSVSRVFTGEGPDDIFGGLEFELRFTPLKHLRRQMLHNFTRELPFELAAQQKLFWDIAHVEMVHPLLYRPLVKLALGLPPRTLIDPKRHMKLLFREAFVGDIPDEFLWRDKAITRVAAGTRRALEARFGAHSTRYYRLYADWLSRCQRSSAHGT
jgi:asparagine synthase (glutamine-hydrolysing)